MVVAASRRRHPHAELQRAGAFDIAQLHAIDEPREVVEILARDLRRFTHGEAAAVPWDHLAHAAEHVEQALERSPDTPRPRRRTGLARRQVISDEEQPVQS